MRTLNILRNSAYSLISFACVALLGIFVRKFFTQYLPVELLGIEGLFSNIIAMLSLAELGVSAIISYNLYREIAKDNKKEINILMSLYRYVYTIIGSFIVCIGVVLFFFLPIIVKNASVSWHYVQLVYVIQIATVLSTYFLAYKRTLFAANQKDYICIKIDMGCKILNGCVQIAAIVCFKNYLLYAFSALFFNILANIIITWKAKKTYPYLESVKVSLTDFRERNFFMETKNFMIHKISYLFYGGLDMVIVTSFLGLKEAGLLSNYVLVHMGIYAVLYKCFQGIIPSLGNLVYSEDKDRSISVYNMLDLAYYFFGSYVCCVYTIVFQPFIGLFFGKQFLLPDEYIVLLGISVFLGMQFENACNYRSTHGNFENDRLYMLLSAISKLIVAVVFAKYWGIQGIVLGTIVGLGFIIYGRIQFVFRIILQISMRKYLRKHLLFSLLTGIEIVGIKYLFAWLDFEITYANLLVECVLIGIIMIVIQSVLFYKTKEFQELLRYASKIVNILKSKLKHS